MKKLPRKLISFLTAAMMICAMLPATALAANKDSKDTVTITVNVFDNITQTLHKNVGTDTVKKGDKLSEEYQIPELSKFTDKEYGSIQKVTGNWQKGNDNCNVGSKVKFHCNEKSAHITYYVDGFGLKSRYAIIYYDGAVKVGEDSVIAGESTTAMSAQPKDGYAFKGWSKTSGGEVDYEAGDKLTPKGDMVLYAVWETVAPPEHTCEDENGDGYCDDGNCRKCLHDHDDDGYCIIDDCEHPQEGDDACCPKPGTGDSTGKVSEPGMDKKAEGKESIGAVRPGQKIGFTLHSTVPQKLAELAKYENGKWKLEGEYQLVFHDTLSSNLVLDKGTIAVKIGEATVDAAYYAVETEGLGTETFTVTVDLVAAFNDGHYFTWEEMGAAPVVVSYSASVAADAADGDTVRNEAYVNHSASDTVVGEVDVTDTPSTGGSGTVLFTISGLGLMSAAAILLLLRRRQSCD